MNKYQQTPELIIDLHRYNTAGVQKILNDLFSRNQYAHIRIIVGKGLHSKGDPVIGTFVKQYLQERNIRFNQSKIQDGGEGSLEVFLH